MLPIDDIRSDADAFASSEDVQQNNTSSAALIIDDIDRRAISIRLSTAMAEDIFYQQQHDSSTPPRRGAREEEYRKPCPPDQVQRVYHRPNARVQQRILEDFNDHHEWSTKSTPISQRQSKPTPPTIFRLRCFPHQQTARHDEHLHISKR